VPDVTGAAKLTAIALILGYGLNGAAPHAMLPLTIDAQHRFATTMRCYASTVTGKNELKPFST
jgi:hypothetical protein